MVAPCSKDELVRAGTCATNKIGKRRVRPSPEGRVAVSEQILHQKRNQAHSGRSTNRTRGTWLQYQAHESRMTAPRKENRTTGEPPEWEKSAVTCEWKSTVHLQAWLERWLTWKWKSLVHLQARLERWLTWEWKSPVHLQARLQRWGDLWVKVYGALAGTSWEVTDLRVGQWCTCKHVLRGEVRLLVSESQWCICKHVLRGEVTCEWKSAVLLVDTSRVTQERPRSLGMEHPEQQQRKRCCRGSNRGETDNLGPI